MLCLVLWCLYVGMAFPPHSTAQQFSLGVSSGDCTVRVLCGQLHTASGAMRKAQPCVGRDGRIDAAWSVSSPPLKRERIKDFSPPLLSSPLLSTERFSSHLLSKTATIGVASPTRSSWSRWAAECVRKCLFVLSDSMLSWRYFPGHFIHLMTPQCSLVALPSRGVGCICTCIWYLFGCRPEQGNFNRNPALDLNLKTCASIVSF